MLDFRGAIFDLDGTLLDSMGVWAQIDVDFLGKRGLPVPPDYLKAVTPMGFRAAAEYTVKRFSLPETPDELLVEWNEMAAQAYAHAVPLKPGAKEYLISLKERGVCLSIATALHEELALPALQNNGIFELFQSMTSLSEVNRGKGFPDVYWRAAEKMGLMPEDCIVFEDIYAGIKGAKDGGFLAVGVYDAYSAHEEAAIRAIADGYITDFTQMR